MRKARASCIVEPMKARDDSNGPDLAALTAEVEALRAAVASLRSDASREADRNDLRQRIDEVAAKVTATEKTVNEFGQLAARMALDQALGSAYGYVPVSVAAAAIGVSRDTLKRWHHDGRPGAPRLTQLPSGRWIADARSVKTTIMRINRGDFGAG